MLLLIHPDKHQHLYANNNTSHLQKNKFTFETRDKTRKLTHMLQNANKKGIPRNLLKIIKSNSTTKGKDYLTYISRLENNL